MSMRFELPAIGYRQGDRQMCVTALPPVTLIKIVARPEQWNPLGKQPHGNRPVDKAHRKGIADYIENEEDYVLGSVVLYASPRDARFVRDENDSDDSIAPGRLSLVYGAEFDVGDGQHRIGALSDVLKAHDEEGDAVMERLRQSGQPAVLVIEANELHRAQDYVDLQRNVKTPTASLSMSMDKRQKINRFVVQLVQNKDLPLFFDKEKDQAGGRVEFLKDSPAKGSAKLFSFKTVRYITGTALGVDSRSSAGWTRAANLAVETNPNAEREMVEMWQGLSTIPGLKAVVDGSKTPADLRADTLLGSAGVQYAIAYAISRAHDDGVPYETAAKALAKVNFNRPRVPVEGQPITSDETLFAGNLIDPESGKIGSGRPAWEAAGDILHKVIVGK